MNAGPLAEVVDALETTRAVDALCDRFEESWRAGPPPDLDTWVPDAEPLRAAALPELVLLDMDYRARAGEQASADGYFERYPELRALPESVARILGSACRLQGAGGASIPSAAAVSSVPGFEIQAELGRGAMGVVYRAKQVALKRIVALKMIREDAGVSEGQRRCLRKEAEAVARLEHPGIVQIHEVGEHQGRTFLTLEFVAGGNLTQKIAGQPLPPDDAARLVEAVARAMHFAHSRNVVHRDLKPANVLLTPDGTPKVSDFGLARQLDGASGQTQIGAVLGTPSFMAPEQASGQAHTAGPAADVYALGAILYNCLTGKPPFHADTPLETLEQVKTRAPVSPRLMERNCPRDLETICLKCLRKEPERRYGSAGEVADDLARFRAGEPIMARPVGALQRGWMWAKRRPAVAGLSAALLAAAVIAVALVTWKWQEEQAARQTAETKEREAEAAKTDADWQKQQALKQREVALDYLKKLADMYTEHGQTLTESGNRPEGEKRYRQALQLFQQLSDDYPETPEYRRGLARVCLNLGTLAADTGRIEESKKLARQAFELFEKLAADQPTVADYRHCLAICCYNTANGLREPADARERDTHYRRAHAIWRQLAAEHPKEPGYRDRVALCCVKIGDGLRGEGRQEWDKSYCEAIGHWQQLAAENPEIRYYRLQVFALSTILGDLLYKTESRRDDAEDLFREPWQYYQKLAEKSPNPDFGFETAVLLYAWGKCLLTNRRYAEAEPRLRECVLLFTRKQPLAVMRYDADSMLGAALAGQGKLTEAEKRLVDSANTMIAHARNLAGLDRQRALDTVQRAVDFFEAQNRPADAAKWRQQVDAVSKGARPPQATAGK